MKLMIPLSQFESKSGRSSLDRVGSILGLSRDFGILLDRAHRAFVARTIAVGLIWAVFLTLFTLSIHSVLSPEAHAEAQESKMDLATHSALITKLENLLPQLANDPQQTQTLQLRLADLYAERARLLEFEAYDRNCDTCEKGALSDRKQAIRYYELSKRRADANELKTVRLQLAHLYQLTGSTQKSKSAYEAILKDRRMRDIHAKAHVGLGEIAFEQGAYEQAKSHYQRAQKALTRLAASETEKTNDRIYIQFRLAWCELNLGNSHRALKDIQSAIQLAQLHNQRSTQKDLMRDYATILARQPFTEKDVEAFISLSPADQTPENLKFLGDEAERLGNKRGALLIWTQYSRQEDKSDEEGADIQMRFAQNFYDLNNTTATLKHLDLVIQAVQKNKCEDCDKVIKQFRQLLVVWNKKEKTNPSAHLSAAYQKYLILQSNDYEAIIWAAQVALQRKDNIAALELYLRAAKLAAEQKRGTEIERVSLVAIEIAETAKNRELHERALLQYLKLNPQGSKRDLVEFQLADLMYQKGEYARAADLYQELAFRRSWKDLNLRRQAADLSLDALEKDKKDDVLRELAVKYSHEFKSHAQHFSEISRRVTVNKTVALVKKGDSRKELEKELKQLSSYDEKLIPAPEKAAHYATLILAAEKLNNVDIVHNAAQKLLKLPKLKLSDKELAQKSLLWVYELRLEFKKAYRLAKTMPFLNLNRDERELRLGLLAELAGLRPDEHFEKYVRWTSSIRGANQIRVKLIRISRRPWQTLESMLPRLRRTPDLLAAITLELHLRKPNDKIVAKVLKSNGVRATAEGRYLQNLQQRNDYHKLMAQLRRHELQAKSDKTLQKNIRARIKLIDSLIRQHKRAVQKGDLSLQVLTLNSIEKENRRFYNQLNALPTPRGLNNSERKMYRRLLAEQSRPFDTAARQAEELLRNYFDQHASALEELHKALSSEDPLQREMARNEYQILKPFLNASERKKFDRTVAENRISEKKVAAAKRDVKKNPFDPSTLEELRELEARRANGPMVAFIEQRLAELKAEARR